MVRNNALTADDLLGAYVALATPLRDFRSHERPEIDYVVVDRLVSHILDSPVRGLIVCATTGLDSFLTNDQRVELTRYVQNNYGKRTRVIAADGNSATWKSVELANRMENEAGVFTHLSISPSYVKPNDDGIITHYETLAKNLSGSIILYSNPSRTGGRGITPEVFEHLSTFSSIIGIKSCNSMESTQEMILRRRGRNCAVLAGNDPEAIPIICSGGAGLISSLGNVFPEITGAIVELTLAGDSSNATRYHQELVPFYSALSPFSKEANTTPLPNLIYYALSQMGFGSMNLPSPLNPGDTFEHELVQGAMRHLDTTSSILKEFRRGVRINSDSRKN